MQNLARSSAGAFFRAISFTCIQPETDCASKSVGKNMATLRLMRSFGFAMTAMMVLGCGGSSDGIKRVQVKGTVTVGGSEPFENGMVFFAPKNTGAKYLGGSAITDENGNFTLKHAKGPMGIEPGEYVVFFWKFLLPDGSEPPEDDEDGQLPWQRKGTLQFVPPEYSSMQSTKYPVTVASSLEEFEFDIPRLEAQKKHRPSKAGDALSDD